MTLKKQALTALACTLLAFPLTAAAQSAQTTYPNKPVRMLVPFAPGGGVDFVGRLMALKLTQRTGQQFVVENRAGANGITGLQALMAAPPTAIPSRPPQPVRSRSIPSSTTTCPTTPCAISPSSPVPTTFRCCCWFTPRCRSETSRS